MARDPEACEKIKASVAQEILGKLTEQSRRADAIADSIHNRLEDYSVYDARQEPPTTRAERVFPPYFNTLLIQIESLSWSLDRIVTCLDQSGL